MSTTDVEPSSTHTSSRLWGRLPERHVLRGYKSFSTSMMNRTLPTEYHAYFSQPPSLHPTIHIRQSSLSNPSTYEQSGCALHTVLYMNDRLFIDPYELEDRWGKGSMGYREIARTEEEHLAKPEEGIASPLVDQVRELPGIIDPTEGLSWSLRPAPDLERPVRYLFKRHLKPPFRATSYRLQLASSPSNAIPSSSGTSIYNLQYPYEAVLHVVQKPSHQANKSCDVVSVDLDIPTHMRYQEPTNTAAGYRTISLGDIGTLGETGEASEADVLISASWICSTSDLPVHDNNIVKAEPPADPEGDTAAGYQHEPHKLGGFDITPLHLVPEAEGKPHELVLPTAIGSHIAFVPPITFVCILLSWIYISRALYRIFQRSRQNVAT